MKIRSKKKKNFFFHAWKQFFFFVFDRFFIFGTLITSLTIFSPKSRCFRQNRLFHQKSMFFATRRCFRQRSIVSPTPIFSPSNELLAKTIDFWWKNRVLAKHSSVCEKMWSRIWVGIPRSNIGQHNIFFFVFHAWKLKHFFVDRTNFCWNNFQIFFFKKKKRQFS